jgi:hypothetical protein
MIPLVFQELVQNPPINFCLLRVMHAPHMHLKRFDAPLRVGGALVKAARSTVAL